MSLRTSFSAFPLALALTLLAGCTMPPLQAIPQPRQAVLAGAPVEMPRIPAPDAGAAEVPAGYRVEIFARDLTYPTSIEFDDNGNAYIAESGYVYGDEAAPARIWKVSSKGRMQIVADQLSGPVTDLLWHQGRLYISQRGKISAMDQGGRIQDLVTGLPSYGDHFNNQMTIGPDGKLYFGQGVATNSGVVGVDNFLFGWLGKWPNVHDVPARDIRVTSHAFLTLDPMVLASSKEPPLVRTLPFRAFGAEDKTSNGLIRGDVKANGTILRMNTDGSALELYAWGLRNPFGVMWGPDGRLYATDNGFDDRGSRPIGNAYDVIWSIRQGGWYGWPDYNAGIPLTDARFKPASGPTPQFIMHDHPSVEKPLATRPHHVGVCKIAFSANGDFGHRGDIFFAEVGDMNPITGNHKEHYGFDVVRLDPKTGQQEVFFRTKPSALGPEKGRLEYVVTAGPKRLVGVRFSPDGAAMYVVDIGAIAVLPTAAPSPRPFPGTGVIWRITREGSAAPKLPGNLSPLPSAGTARVPGSQIPAPLARR